MPTTTDFLVIGAGVIGLNVARDLNRRFKDSSVTLIDKETTFGLHASGRNSGVLHAGFYYTPDSLKARLTKTGNRELTVYCESKRLSINRCGKLVVARDSQDLVSMGELLARGRANGIALEEITADQALQIEPRVKTYERALFSPTTSTVDPNRVLASMFEDAKNEGVILKFDVAYRHRLKTSVVTSAGNYDAGYVVNAAGLYADVVARDFGFSQRYRILPFKGLYLYSDEPEGAFNTNIYPVPNLQNPFLGVHLTVDVYGRSKIGPTAIPAFWREQYGGFSNFSGSELADLIARQISLFGGAGFDFKRLALQEIKKYSRSHLVKLATNLVNGLDSEKFRRWGRSGIRAQLVDIQQKKLEMDFVVEGNKNSMHILNAVSPGFTCAIPFSEYVGGKIAQVLG